MRCSQCGRENVTGSNHCADCGAKLPKFDFFARPGNLTEDSAKEQDEQLMPKKGANSFVIPNDVVGENKKADVRKEEVDGNKKTDSAATKPNTFVLAGDLVVGSDEKEKKSVISDTKEKTVEKAKVVSEETANTVIFSNKFYKANDVVGENKTADVRKEEVDGNRKTDSAATKANTFVLAGDLAGGSDKKEKKSVVSDTKEKSSKEQKTPRKKTALWASCGAIAAACLLLVIYLFWNSGKNDARTGGNSLMSELERVGEEIFEIEESYLNSEGKLADEDVAELVDAVYDKVVTMKNVSYCEKNTFGVYMILADGMGVHYTVPVEGLASSGSEISIYSYQPYYDEFVNGESGILNKGSYPDKAIEALCDLDITASKPTAALHDGAVTLEQIKKMQGNSVIVWVGHGGYSKERHSTLCLPLEVNEDFLSDYKADIEAGRIEVYISAKKMKMCITAAFFEAYLPDGALDNSIIYLAACHSGQDNVLAETLIRKGAVTVYGNSDKLLKGYNNVMCRSVIEALCEGKTAGQALEKAKEKHGAQSNVLFGIIRESVYVRCVGDASFTLTTLFQGINRTETPPAAYQTFSGEWELSALSEVRQWPANTAFSITFAGSSVTLSTNSNISIYDSYRVVTVQGYSCLLFPDGYGLVQFNQDMIGLIYLDEDSGNDCTLRIGGKVYSGDFYPLSNIFMRKGSATTQLPNNLNIDWEELDATIHEIIYYPGAGMLHIYLDDEFMALCVYDNGNVEYIEELSMPWADNLPFDTIITGRGYVITDNK